MKKSHPLTAAVCAVLFVVGFANAKLKWKHFDGNAQVTTPTDILYRESHGDFNVQQGVRMYHKAQFPIASNTKLFTATAIYQLQEAGLLNVTDSVADYLNATDFANFGHPSVSRWCPVVEGNNASQCERITFQNLLSMSSGIIPTLRCATNPPQFAKYCGADNYVVYPGSIGLMVGTFILNPLMWAPGTSYAYTNPNFILSAYLIEKISGMRYGDYLDKHIIKPAGLHQTYFDPYNNQFEMNPNRINEYHRFVDSATDDLISTGLNTIDMDSGSLSGTGGLVSSMDDEEKFYRTLFNFTSMGAPLLKDPNSLRSIISPVTALIPKAPEPTFFGQGVIVVCYKGDAACAKGPQFIIYMGGTLCVHTANLFDIRPKTSGSATTDRAYILTQVWQSSLLYNSTRAEYEAAKRGVGNFFAAAAPLQAGALPTMTRAWMLQGEYAAPPS